MFERPSCSCSLKTATAALDWDSVPGLSWSVAGSNLNVLKLYATQAFQIIQQCQTDALKLFSTAFERQFCTNIDLRAIFYLESSMLEQKFATEEKFLFSKTLLSDKVKITAQWYNTEYLGMLNLSTPTV